ncbi:MAG: chloride channel protein [Oscillospiraceae bacterium]|nr:chloride channel protein [Oscillospiraceae bacterium]
MKDKLTNLWANAWPTLRMLLFWTAMAGVIGLVCGGAGGAFSHALAGVTGLRERYPWLVYLMPAAGLVIVFCYSACGMENDSGTNQIIASVRSGKRPPLRLAALIFLGTALTHLTGGSAGREGAALQIGGSLASGVGRLFRFGERSMNLAVMCGMSGLFSALFGTPLAAAVFSLEVVSIGIFHYSALFPCLMSAYTAAGVARLMGVAPEGYTLLGLPELGLLPMVKTGVLALLCGLLAILFCVVIHEAGHLYQKLLPNRYVRVAVGGAVIVALTLLLGTRDYNGAGAPIIERALEGHAVPWAFAAKLLFTALTLGAGFRGGEIVPAFFTGATFGCVVAPLLGLDPAFGAAIGMIALFCGVVNCPIASILISVELFGGEGLLFFAMACGVSFLLSGKFSLYSAQKIVYSKLEPRFINENAK